MARNIEGLTSAPAHTRLRTWGRALIARRAGLRMYQWLWLLLCVAGALAVVLPRALSQPVIYQATAEAHFDVTRYQGLYNAQGEPAPQFTVAMRDARCALHELALPACELRFNAPDEPANHRVDFDLPQPGVVEVQGLGSTAAEAQRLANEGAEELVRQIRAAGGREILRNLLGWEMVAALHGEDPATPFQRHLRSIIEHTAFPMSRPIEPVAARIAVESLLPQEQQDLARALEARYDLWTFEINARNTSLDTHCEIASGMSSSARTRALQACAADDPAVAAEYDLLTEAVERRAAISAALQYMIEQHQVTFTPDERSAAYRVSATLPAEPQPRHIGLYVAFAMVIGVAFGSLSIAVDRSARLMPRLQDLWEYRELIRNMVLRDLRARYKGSTLGYLWTQIAPLLMMLVFMFVFTFLLPTNIALFPVFLIVALLPWNYCAESVGGGTRSIIDNAHLVKKVFFPREVLPLANVLSALVNYILSLPMMFLVMAISQLVIVGQIHFSFTFAYLPVIVIIQTIFLAGVVFFLSTVAVFWRDTVHLVGILLQFWFFLTPVFYSLDIMGGQLARIVRWVNPMASIIDFYRDILYGGVVIWTQAPVRGMPMPLPTPGLPALDSMLRVLLTSLLVLAFGYWFFQRHCGRFGEEL